MNSQYNFYDCSSQLPRDGWPSSPEMKAANGLKRQFPGKTMLPSLCFHCQGCIPKRGKILQISYGTVVIFLDTPTQNDCIWIRLCLGVWVIEGARNRLKYQLFSEQWSARGTPVHVRRSNYQKSGPHTQKSCLSYN